MIVKCYNEEMRIGEQIKKARGHETQASVAGKAGIDAPHLCRIESGETDPQVSTVEKVALALGKSLELVELAG